MPNVCRARNSYNTTDEINEAKTMQLHPILDLFVFTFEKCKTKFYYIIYYTFNTYLINRICAGYSPMHLASVKVTATLILPWSSLNSLYTADGDVGRLKQFEGQTSIHILVFSCFRFLFNKLWGRSTSTSFLTVPSTLLHYCYSRYHYYLSLYLDMSTRNWIHIEGIDIILFTKLNRLVIIQTINT